MITKQIQARVLEWLASSMPDHRSDSAHTIAFWLAFNIVKPGAPYPCTSSDIAGCLNLFRDIGELHGYLFRMAKVSPEWKLLISEWESIESMFFQDDATGSKTDALIRSILRRA